jgi:tetratricopeptide (TPR) repeat protein
VAVLFYLPIKLYVSWMNPWAVLIVVYAAVFISGPLIIIFHEIGHGLAYLILTKPDKIEIYIGSHGDKKNTFQFTAGRFVFFTKRKALFLSGRGLCVSDKAEEDYKKYFIILLAGPLFSLFAAGVTSLFAFAFHAHLLVQIFFYIFLVFAALSLISNLVPRQINQAGRAGLQSDGAQIAFILKLKDRWADYIEANKYYHEKQYAQAVTGLKNILDEIPAEPKILRLIIVISILEKRYAEATVYIETLEQKNQPTINDLMTKGYLQAVTQKHDEAIATYHQVLKKDRNNLLALNNIASELVEEGAYEVAQRALDKALKINPKFAHTYNTMGYLRIAQGHLADAKKLIDKCLELDAENAEAHKMLGIYYLKLNDAETARLKFNKAVALNSNIELGIYAEELKKVNDKQVIT